MTLVALPYDCCRDPHYSHLTFGLDLLSSRQWHGWLQLVVWHASIVVSLIVNLTPPDHAVRALCGHGNAPRFTTHGFQARCFPICRTAEFHSSSLRTTSSRGSTVGIASTLSRHLSWKSPHRTVTVPPSMRWKAIPKTRLPLQHRPSERI